jgi:hypothetical protein
VGPANPLAHGGTLRLPSGAELIVTTGYSKLDLPAMKMTTLVGGKFFDKAIKQIENHDGDLDGARVDARLANIAEHTFADGQHWLGFGVSGFFARYNDADKSSCHYTAKKDCAQVNIVDFDHKEENNTGPFGKLNINTRRDVYHWGAAVDARFGWVSEGGLKGAIQSLKYVSPFKFGIAVRGLNQHNELHAVDKGVKYPADYDEKLDTRYYGAYFGIEHKMPIHHGWSLTFDGTAGGYHTYTNYEGRYMAYIPIGGEDCIQEIGGIDKSSERTSFIGTLRVGLERTMTWASFGLYGQAEYLSYVPKVLYNNDDKAGGSPFGIVGTQVGTRLTSDSAVSYTGGVSLTIPIE